MNEIAVLESETTAYHAEPPRGDTGFELFGLGWRPPTSNEYVGRHRAPDA